MERIPILLMWQIAATTEERRPTAGDFAQCKQVLEAEANVIGFLHPREPAEWRTHDSPIMDLHLDKVRHGQTGTVPLTFHRKWTRFEPEVNG